MKRPLVKIQRFIFFISILLLSSCFTPFLFAVEVVEKEDVDETKAEESLQRARINEILQQNPELRSMYERVLDLRQQKKQYDNPQVIETQCRSPQRDTVIDELERNIKEIQTITPAPPSKKTDKKKEQRKKQREKVKAKKQLAQILQP